MKRALERGVWRRRATFTPLLAAFLPSCQGTAGDAVDDLVRDSAGYHVVDSAEPVWALAGAWEVAPRARFTIDGPVRTTAGAQPAVSTLDTVRGFGHVWSGLFVDRDRIAVADLTTYRIHLFDGRGRAVGSFGGRADTIDGFGSLVRMFRYRGDSLAIHDLARSRLALFDRDGVRGRAITVGDLRGTAIVIGAFGDGRFVLRENVRARGQGGPGPNGDTSALLVWNSALGGADEIARVPRLDGAGRAGRAGQALVYFAPVTQIVAGENVVYWARSDTYEIRRIHADGAPDAILRRPWTPVPVTDEMWTAYRDALMWRVPDADVAERMMAAGHAGTLPAFAALHIAPGEQLWVQRHPVPGSDEPETWDVFGADGRWLGPIRMPPGALLLDVGEDGVLVRVPASDGAGETVRVHEIMPASGPIRG